ncbi:MAG: hypothetical protein K5793_03270 [Nitrosarchaeum sp.]|nr:hypothetical protein [Nitrosarchaeum sp.]MCV0398931.1 hypothetical protein [Nitrosarchaeum sp.]
MSILQAKEMIRSRIEYKENQIKTRKIQLDSGKFETIMDIIEVEIKNLQKDIEFFKMIEKELES